MPLQAHSHVHMVRAFLITAADNNPGDVLTTAKCAALAHHRHMANTRYGGGPEIDAEIKSVSAHVFLEYSNTLTLRATRLRA